MLSRRINIQKLVLWWQGTYTAAEEGGRFPVSYSCALTTKSLCASDCCFFSCTEKTFICMHKSFTRSMTRIYTALLSFWFCLFIYLVEQSKMMINEWTRVNKKNHKTPKVQATIQRGKYLPNSLYHWIYFYLWGHWRAELGRLWKCKAFEQCIYQNEFKRNMKGGITALMATTVFWSAWYKIFLFFHVSIFVPLIWWWIWHYCFIFEEPFFLLLW